MRRFLVLHFPVIGLMALLGCMPMANRVESEAQKEQENKARRTEIAADIAKQRDVFRALVKRTLGLIPLCAAGDAREAPPFIRGKVLIWDAGANDVSEAHLALPDEIRASNPESATAVILILKQERRALPFFYSEFGKKADRDNGPRGVRIDSDVCVLDLARQQPLGRFHIQGQQPPFQVKLEPGQTEVVGDWVAGMKEWTLGCTNPKPQVLTKGLKGWRRQADAAKPALSACEGGKHLPAAGTLPPRALIWDAQTDRLHPGLARLTGDVKSHPDDESVTVFLVTDQQYIQGETTGRFDFVVSIVTLPSAKPIGAFTVKGEEWPLPNAGGNWADRHPEYALAKWVTSLSKSVGKR